MSSVGIAFKVNHGITSGVRYIQVVKRSGLKGMLQSLRYTFLLKLYIVDKLEQMLGSYAPSPDGSPYTKDFEEEESPSGMIARSGTYNVRSRVIDDDGHIYAGEYWIFVMQVFGTFLGPEMAICPLDFFEQRSLEGVRS